MLDGSAIGLSGLCLVHCLALPAAAALLPVLGAWAEAEWVHILLVALATPVAALAVLRRPADVTFSWLVAALATAGVLLLTLGALGPHDWERVNTVAGIFSLVGAHILNWRRRAAVSRLAARPPTGRLPAQLCKGHN